MSSSSNDYTSISSVSKTLLNQLWSSIKTETQPHSIISSDDQISLNSPKDLVVADSTKKLSLFLYNITEFSSMKNSPPEKPNKQPSRYFTLHYLITPYTQDTENDQILLAKILQVFIDTPVLSGSLLQGVLAGTDTQLRVTLNSLTLNELNKLWTLLSTPFMTSLSYSVSPVKIEPTREEKGVPVFEKQTVYRPSRDESNGQQ